jgi:hypothetical protein
MESSLATLSISVYVRMPRVTKLVDRERIGVIDGAVALIVTLAVHDEEKSAFRGTADVACGIQIECDHRGCSQEFEEAGSKLQGYRSAWFHEKRHIFD